MVDSTGMSTDMAICIEVIEKTLNSAGHTKRVAPWVPDRVRAGRAG